MASHRLRPQACAQRALLVLFLVFWMSALAVRGQDGEEPTERSAE